jgi:hypothetical protein
MRALLLASILLAEALLPSGVRAAAPRSANLNVTVVVVRHAEIEVPRARTAAGPTTARAAAPIVFVDGAPPGLAVELRAEPRSVGARGPG